MNNTIITSRSAYDKLNQLLETVILQLQEYSDQQKIDFGEQCFEDMTGNEICGFDNEYVYMGYALEDNNETYPLHELDINDAIKILGDIEAGVIKICL